MFPIVDLDGPTKLAVEWGWLLATRANFLVYLLIVIVFVLGASVRVPGVRRVLSQAEARAGADAGRPGEERTPGE